jgi:hypothetical protein
MKKRRGRFTISMSLLREVEEGRAYCREQLKQIMGMCVVYRAEARFENDSVEYWAFSELFEEKEEYESAPEYRWIVDTTIDEETKKEKYAVRFERVKE